MSTLFMSDLHLHEGQPEVAGWLQDFLEGPARAAEALYILGDLFEYWIGDDALSPLATAVAAWTAQLDAANVACFFVHGNRDFLIGRAYAEQAGLRLLPEEVVVAMREHHNPDYDDAHSVYANLVLIANRLLRAVALGDEGSDDLPEAVLARLQLPEDEAMEAFQTLMESYDGLDSLAVQIAA